MKKLLNMKIIIPVVIGLVVVLLLGSIAYILFAPSTWWKPFYIKMEMNGSASEAQAAGQTQAEAPAAATTSHQTLPEAPVAAELPQSQLSGSGGSSMRHPPGLMYELDNKVVNLAEPGGLRYLQAAIVLELWPLDEGFYKLEGEERTKAEEEFKKLIDARRPIIDDIVTTTLSSKTFNQISTVEGKNKLKEELMGAINNALGYQGVISVYFTNFVVQ